MKANEGVKKYSFFYRVQGGKSYKTINIVDGKIEFRNKFNQMLYIGSRDHMLYFLKKRTLCKKSLKQIFEEGFSDVELKIPAEVIVMLVPNWYKTLIQFYAEDRETKFQKYYFQQNRRFTPELTDLSTPGDCYGIAYYLKALLSEVSVYSKCYPINKQKDIVEVYDYLVNPDTLNVRRFDEEKITQLLCRFNNKMVSLGEEPIPNRILGLIERDIVGISENIMKGIGGMNNGISL